MAKRRRWLVGVAFRRGTSHRLLPLSECAGEVPRPVGEEFQRAGLHLAAVLRALKVTELVRELVSGFHQGQQARLSVRAGRIQSCNLPAPSHQNRSLPSGRRPYKWVIDFDWNTYADEGSRESRDGKVNHAPRKAHGAVGHAYSRKNVMESDAGKAPCGRRTDERYPDANLENIQDRRCSAHSPYSPKGGWAGAGERCARWPRTRRGGQSRSPWARR